MYKKRLHIAVTLCITNINSAFVVKFTLNCYKDIHGL